MQAGLARWAYPGSSRVSGHLVRCIAQPWSMAIGREAALALNDANTCLLTSLPLRDAGLLLRSF